MASNRRASEIAQKVRLAKNKPLAYWSAIGRVPTNELVALAHEFNKFPIVKPFAFGPLYPTEYWQNYAWPNGVFGVSDEVAIGWLAAQLRVFASSINEFLRFETRFTSHLMAGEYATALQTLDQIDISVGKSMWALENRLSILEISQGVGSQKIYLEGLLERSKSELGRGIFATIVTYFSYKAEKNVTVDKFNNDLRRALGLNGSELISEFDEFYLFNLSFFGDYRFTRIGPLITFVQGASLVDRYLVFIRLAQLVAIDEHLMAYSAQFKKALSLVTSVIGDRRIQALGPIYGISQFSNVADAASATAGKKFKYLLDQYTIGSFDSIDKNAIKSLPILKRISWMEIGAKIRGRVEPKISHTQLDEALSSLPQLDSIETVIVKILLKDERSEEAAVAILKLVNQFSMSSWAAEIFGILMRELRHGLAPGMGRYTLFGDLNGSPYSPRLLSKISTETYADNSVAHSLLRAAEVGDLPAIDQLEDKLPRPRYLKYRGIAAMRADKTEVAGDAFTELYRIGDLLDRQDAIENLAHCVIEFGRPIEAIPAIVDALVALPAYRSRVSVSEFVTAVICAHEKALVPQEWLIALPLMQDMLYRGGKFGSEGARSAATDEFLAGARAERPSNLVGLVDGIPVGQLVFFLRHVCVPSVLDSNVSYVSSRDLEDERVKICHWLMSLDGDNRQIYADEIAAIAQKQLIVKDVTDIEKSKIHVDVEGIRNAVFIEGKDLFLRFRSLPKTDREAILDLVSQVSNQLRTVDGKTIQIVLPASKRGDAFREFYAFVRDRFVSSNEHGLDVYLSVGIRHSTLEKHLRSVFEAQNLITQKDQLGMYVLNTYWTDDQGLSPLAPKDAHALFEEFSIGVDSLIATLKNQWIQIKTEGKNPDGLFDFSIASNEMGVVMKQVSLVDTFEEAIDLIILNLWERTDKCLAKVRSHLHSELLGNFERLLQELSQKSTSMGAATPTLNSAIAQARTNIQSQILRTSEWFSRSSRRDLSDFPFGHAVDIAIEMLSRCYPAKPLKPIREIRIDGLLKGESLIGIVTVLHTAFDNILEHCHVSGRTPVVRLTASRTTEGIEIKIRNEVSRVKSELKAEQDKLAQLVEEATSSKSLDKVRREGGTGLLKISRAIRIDLRATRALSATLGPDYFELVISIFGGKVAL